ncbi:tetratricopeptide repeat protein [bacterium]|nr:tetratricopeptide repeat protein [bacterium]
MLSSNYKRLLVCGVGLIIALCMSNIAYTSEDSTYQFGVSLFNERDFYRAVTEFKRYAFEAGTQEAKCKSGYAAAACYQQAREWARACDAWSQLISEFPNDPIVTEAAYRLAECMLASGNYDDAQNVCVHYVESAPAGSDYTDDAAFLQGIIKLTRHDWKGAKECFVQFQKSYVDSPLKPAAKSLTQRCDFFMAVRRKSPAKAALMSSIIPGTGQGYAGRAGDGWTAFLVNAVFAGFAIDRFHRGDDSAGVVLGLLSFSFYAGNVYGAGGAAAARNRADEEKQIKLAMSDIQATVAKNLGHPDRLHP